MTESPEFIPTLTHAVERDVDLVLVEELKCDPAFVRWLLDQVSPNSAGFDDVRVLHSKRRTYNRREIDIHVEVLRSDKRPPLILLIENKLDATEQPNQGFSYREEIEVLVRQKAASEAYAILVCPDAYRDAWPAFAKHFTTVTTYESVEAYLRRRAAKMNGELALRLGHHADLIAQALGKYRRGYVAIPIIDIAGFNAQYLRLLAALAPEIIPGPGLRDGQAKPSDSVSMIFDPQATFASLPAPLRPTRFAHELGRGSVDRANYVNVQFRGFSAGWERLDSTTRKAIEADGIEVELKRDRRSGKTTLRFKIATPPVDNQAPFSASERELRTGIEAAARLRRWCIDRQTVIERIAKLSGIPC